MKDAPTLEVETADWRQIGDKIAEDGAQTIEIETACWKRIGDKFAVDGALMLEMETAAQWTTHGTADCNMLVEIDDS